MWQNSCLVYVVKSGNEMPKYSVIYCSMPQIPLASNVSLAFSNDIVKLTKISTETYCANNINAVDVFCIAL